MSTYFVLHLKNVRKENLEVVTALGFEIGAAGSEEVLAFRQNDLAYEPSVIETESTDICFYFEKSLSEDQVRNFDEFCESASIVQYENKDWMEEWKKHFTPIQLVGPYWIVPSWLQPPQDCIQPIRMDPGMAFGTGMHETTQLASELLMNCLNKKSDVSVADIGTGTGILGLIAAKEGAKVLCNDIDQEARRVARENFRNNLLDEAMITDLQLNEIDEAFDIVVANILDFVLVRLAPDLIRILKPKGRLVLSGILLDNDDKFREEFSRLSRLQVERRVQKNDWVGYIFS